MAHPGGRPTDYTPELVEKARNYAIVAKANARCVEPTPKQRIVSMADLALHLDVSRETLYDWGRTYPEFSDILKTVMAAQETMLTDKGLQGEWNATITKLMLSKHGYRESQDITTDGKALPTPILGAATKNETI